LLDRGRLFAAAADRTSSLIEAEEWLRPVAGGLAGDDLTWNAQLLLADVVRLRGDTKQAAAMLAAIERSEPPQSVVDRIVGQRVRILLDLQKPADAAELLS